MKATILKQGYSIKYDGEATVCWWLFESRHTNEEIYDALWESGVEVNGRDIHSAYDCTGKAFADGIRIGKRGKHRVVVTQWWYLDI